MMADQEDEPAATDLELPTDSSSEAESDSSSEAAPPSQARCTESSDSDDNDEMPSLEDDRGTIAPAARADMAPEEPETVLEDNETAPAPVPVPANDEDANPTKEAKCVEAISAAAANLVCPIAQALPTEPVTAEDGHIYEREAIESWFRAKDGDPTSPITGARMGTRLLEAHQVRNTIEALVKSGAVDSELATAWKRKLADETLVKETRSKAELGDANAMWRLGLWYGSGMKGLAKDMAQSRAWYERSAATRDTRGMALFGECLLNGCGGPKDIGFGLVNVTEAAGLGSDFAACNLGELFFHGNFGLPKDPVRARFWLKKIADGECAHKHLNEEWMAKCRVWLRELDE